MTRVLSTLLGTFALTATIVTAQVPQQAPPAAQEQEQTQKPDVSLTGCLVQGSGPDVFILENAKLDAESQVEEGRNYLVVPGTEDLFLRNHVNTQITVRGAAEDKMVPEPQAGEQVNEQELPKLTAKSVVPVADTCAIVR